MTFNPFHEIENNYRPGPDRSGVHSNSENFLDVLHHCAGGQFAEEDDPLALAVRVIGQRASVMCWSQAQYAECHPETSVPYPIGLVQEDYSALRAAYLGLAAGVGMSHPAALRKADPADTDSVRLIRHALAGLDDVTEYLRALVASKVGFPPWASAMTAREFDDVIRQLVEFRSVLLSAGLVGT